MAKVITWQAPDGSRISLTRQQERKLRKYGIWPRNQNGEEYCNISHGLHDGARTWTDEALNKWFIGLKAVS